MPANGTSLVVDVDFIRNSADAAIGLGDGNCPEFDVQELL
jgi:hypothetical protein